MTKEERQKKIIQAVKEIVRKKGMDGFSIRQAAELTGINESLIYRDFYTKDNLLDICYKQIQDEIAQIYVVLGPLDLSTEEQTVAAMKDMWMKSFCYLIEHPDNAIFLRNYRESSYRKKLLISGLKREPKYFFEARDKFAIVLPQNIDIHCTWVYIIDLSLEMAVKMILGELPKDDAAVERVWNIMYTGLSNKVQINIEKENG
jgi:AcrR family transcriptional regulator